jgi:hypothetical protein
VHELLTNDDTVTPCNPPLDVGDPKSGSDCKDFDILHCNEIPGRDIMADDQGLWRDIASQIFSKQAAEISVHAGPILHRGEFAYSSFYFDHHLSQNHVLAMSLTKRLHPDERLWCLAIPTIPHLSSLYVRILLLVYSFTKPRILRYPRKTTIAESSPNGNLRIS